MAHLDTRIIAIAEAMIAGVDIERLQTIAPARDAAMKPQLPIANTVWLSGGYPQLRRAA